MASMFGGANNVKVFGGDFKVINGSYHHHEHNTNYNNANSNNIVGNAYKDEYNDHSQTIYGGYHQAPRRHPKARRAETANESAQHHDTLASSTPTLAYPSRSKTIPSTAMKSSSSSQFGRGMLAPYSNPYPSAGPVLQTIQTGNNMQRTYMYTKPGDIQGMDPEQNFHFQVLMSSLNRPDQNDEEELEDANEEPDTALHCVEPDVMQAYASSRSPPTSKMAQLSLGDPSLFPDPRSLKTTAPSVVEQLPSAPLSQPQGQAHYAPPTAISTSAQALPPSSFLSQYPYQYQPQYQGPQFQQNHQRYQPAPVPNLSNLSPFLRGVFHAAANAAKMQPSVESQSFSDAPRGSSSTFYDTASGSASSAISTDNNDGFGSAADAEVATTANGYSPEGLNDHALNGAFTELRQTINTNHHEFSGMVANNSAENSYNWFGGQDDKAEHKEGEDEPVSGTQKPKTAGKQGRVPPRNRQS